MKARRLRLSQDANKAAARLSHLESSELVQQHTKQRRGKKQRRGRIVEVSGTEEQTHVLFGGLIARLESVIRDDKGLREALAEHAGGLTRRV